MEITFLLDLFIFLIMWETSLLIFLFKPKPNMASTIISHFFIWFSISLKFWKLINLKKFFFEPISIIFLPSLPLLPGPQKNKKFFLLNSFSIKLRIDKAEL